MIAARDLHVSYGPIAAVRGVSLRVDEGQLVALLGANGAGKSTTLRALARLEPVAGGAITLGGRSIAALSAEDAVRAGVALVPEGRAIFPTLSVRENLELGAWAHKDKRLMAETMARVVALFPRVGERMAQAGGTLSGGEQQMVAIGRALMARPRVLLLDEPSLGMAPMLARAILAAVRAIADSGVAVLLVEQNTRLALAVADRAYVMQSGTVVLEGDARALAEHPRVKSAYLGD